MSQGAQEAAPALNGANQKGLIPYGSSSIVFRELEVATSVIGSGMRARTLVPNPYQHCRANATCPENQQRARARTIPGFRRSSLIPVDLTERQQIKLLQQSASEIPQERA